MTDPKAMPADDTCNAKTRGGGHCRRPAGWGTKHAGQGRCKLHGGSTPLHQKSAEIAVARVAVNELALPRNIHPMDALLEELARTAGAVKWLDDKVQSVEEQSLIAPTGGGQGGVPEYKRSVWVTLWEDERAHMARVAKMCLDAGIDERRVRLAEAQGQLMATAIQNILAKLKLSEEQARLAPAIVRNELTALAPVAIEASQA